MPSRRSKAREPALTIAPELSEEPSKKSSSIPKRESSNPKSSPPPTLPPTTKPTAEPSFHSSDQPPNWPSTAPYLTTPKISPYLPLSHQKWLRTKPQPQPSTTTINTPESDHPILKLPLSPTETQSRVEIRIIQDENHPAYGQRGLFAARDLEPDELVVGYLGLIHSSTVLEIEEWRVRQRQQQREEGGVNQTDSDTKPHSTPFTNETEADTDSPPSSIGKWDTSSYDLNMYRTDTIELAIDAAEIGNEARFVNDYRGVPVQQVSNDNGSSEADSLRKGRKEKRKVKGWEASEHREGVMDDGRAGNDNDEGPQSNGQWTLTKEEQYRYDSAMPNAEFRDVWFEMQDDLNLDLGLRDSEPTAVFVETSSSSNGNSKGLLSSNTTEIIKLGDTTNGVLNISSLSLDSSSSTIARDRDIPLPDSANLKTGRTRRKKKTGIRGVAVYVMPAGKAGKRKGGIKKGQEVLVSYGKGFWAHHT